MKEFDFDEAIELIKNGMEHVKILCFVGDKGNKGMLVPVQANCGIALIMGGDFNGMCCPDTLEELKDLLSFRFDRVCIVDDFD